MDDVTLEKLLKIALVAFGAIFFTVYPLSLIWPSGWQWHGGQGQYYFQMICGIYAVLGAYLIAAARNPSEYRSLISFTVWSSIVHAGIMAIRPYMTNTRLATWLATCLHYCLLLSCSGTSLARGSYERSAHSNGVALSTHRYPVGKIGSRAAG